MAERPFVRRPALQACGMTHTLQSRLARSRVIAIDYHLATGGRRGRGG